MKPITFVGRTPTALAALFTAASIALLGGCADPIDGGDERTIVDGDGESTTETRTDLLEVRTRFVLEGIDDLDSAVIDRLYVNVGAIFLDPIERAEGGVSFANRLPFSLDFDVDSRTRTIDGPTMYLPFGGDFVVSLLLEPQQVGEGDLTVEVEGAYLEEADFVNNSFRSGEPMPLPWRTNSFHANTDRSLQQYVDFRYRSNRSARIELDSIELSETGQYDMTLTVNLGDWIDQIVLPAVQQRGSNPFQVVLDGEVLVENEFYEAELGIESLIGDIGVSTSAREQ